MKEIPAKEAVFLIRKRFRISLEELAAASGFSMSHISLFENNKREMSDEALKNLQGGLLKLVRAKVKAKERERERISKEMGDEIGRDREEALRLSKVTTRGMPELSAGLANLVVSVGRDD